MLIASRSCVPWSTPALVSGICDGPGPAESADSADSSDSSDSADPPKTPRPFRLLLLSLSICHLPRELPSLTHTYIPEPEPEPLVLSIIHN